MGREGWRAVRGAKKYRKVPQSEINVYTNPHTNKTHDTNARTENKSRIQKPVQKKMPQYRKTVHKIRTQKPVHRLPYTKIVPLISGTIFCTAKSVRRALHIKPMCLSVLLSRRTIKPMVVHSCCQHLQHRTLVL